MYGVFRVGQFLKQNNPYTIYKRQKCIKDFLISSPRYESLVLPLKNIKLAIYVIAFNNSKTIQYQYQFLKKFMKDPFVYVVVDNSDQEEKSDEIKEFCLNNKISYVKLPENKLLSSRSHGLALNYVMEHYVINKKINTPYIGFLDHDCFPIKNVSIIPILQKQKIYGRLIDTIPVKLGPISRNATGGKWFLRPGCAFYDVEVFNKGYSFLPYKSLFPLSFLDSGGGNRKYIYMHFNKENLILLQRIFRKNLEYIGEEFLHIGGVALGEKSEYKRISDGYNFLDSLLCTHEN